MKNLVGVAPMLADSPPICTVGWVAKTEIYVLAVQPICPVQQTFRYCFNKGALLKSYRTYYFLKRCNIASFMICFVIFYRFGLAALWRQLRKGVTNSVEQLLSLAGSANKTAHKNINIGHYGGIPKVMEQPIFFIVKCMFWYKALF